MTHRSIPHAWLFGFLLALLPGLTPRPAHAQPPTLFSTLEPAADFAAPLQTTPSNAPGPPPLRHRQVAIDLPLLDTIHETADTASTTSTLTLNLFPDAAFPAVITTVEPTYSGGYALSGHLAGEPLSTFTLVVNDDEIAGSVLTPLDSYEIDSTPDLPGGVVIRQMDSANQPDECETHEPDSLPESESTHLPPAPTSSSSPTIIDVAVFYTPLVKSRKSNIESHIDSIVAATNQAFVDSNVNQRLRLVHRGQVNYTESGSLATDLYRLKDVNDGHMDAVHGIRDEVDADLVHVVAARGNCGQAFTMKNIRVGWAGYAFSMHHYSCGGRAFTHELGHNLGLRHDRHVNQENVPQPCAHGYVNQEGLKPGAPGSARWLTVMAVKKECSEAGLSCVRLHRFSNANQSHNGDPLGVAGCQRSSSKDGPAHAVETLANSAGTAAAFRNSTPSFGDETIANKTYTKDLVIPSLTLPTGTNGNAPLTYSVSGLPAGLSFDTDSRTLSGTPTGTQAAQTATYTVTDLDADTASLTFTLTVVSVGLTAAAGNQQVTLSWTSGADSQAGITQWEYQQGSGAWTAIPDSAQQATGSYTVTGLTNGTTYTFKVQAVNAQGNAVSASVTATPVTTPAKPTGLTATVNDQQVTLNWTAPTNTGGSAITAYQVSQDSGTTWTGTGSTTTSHTVTGLTNGTAYPFQVRAVNSQGNGAASDSVTATPATIPAKPTNLTATAGHHQVTLAWTSGGDGGSAILEWHYSWDDGVNWAKTDSTATHYPVYLPTNKTPYTFRVRGVNAKGLGPPSESVSATPRAFTATKGNGPATLNWSKLPANTAIVGWEYRQRAGSGEYGAWTAIPNSTTHTRRYTVANLTNGTAYTFQVRGKDSNAAILARIEFPPVTPEPSPPPGGNDNTSGGGGGTGGGGGGDPTDRHGNTPATATRVTVGSSTPGQLHARSDRDYFTLTVPQAGLLVIETTGSTDTRGTLTTPDGHLFVQAATGGTGRNFQLTRRVTPGSYLVVVRGTGTGSYHLEVDLIVGFVDNPQPDSAQSGIGVVSGWVCEAESVEVELDGVLQEAAYGTERTDTAPYCGDTNNGFGVLYNWNRLGDGTHPVRVVVDGIVFATLSVTVTTLGLGEFPTGLQGDTTLTDFPSEGESVRLVWQEAQQNFALADGPVTPGGSTKDPTWAVLGNPAPGSYQSGIRVISGWVCEAEVVVVEIAGAYRLTAAYGTERTDTAEHCGDTDNGFGVLFNWNRLGDGEHTMRLLVDGEEWATAAFMVTTLGEEVRRGVVHTAEVADFPAEGEAVTVEWQEAQQNFVVTGVRE